MIPAAEYLRMSYYEKWLTGLTELLLKHGFISQEELASGKPTPALARQNPALPAGRVPVFIARGSPASRGSSQSPRFRPGERGHARNINPTGHTLLPRYVRGKSGPVDRVHGVFVFPDSNARFQGENPQHLYSVRFEAHELWGDEAAPRDAVYLDLWDGYLDGA